MTRPVSRSNLRPDWEVSYDPYVGLLLSLTLNQRPRCGGIWQSLADAGISDFMLGLDYPPHMTLFLADEIDTLGMRSALRGLAAQTPPLPTRFPSVGIFPGPQAVMFLAPSTNRGLLDLHLRCWQVMQPYTRGIQEHYRPGVWVPHVTVGFGLDPGPSRPGGGSAGPYRPAAIRSKSAGFYLAISAPPAEASWNASCSSCAERLGLYHLIRASTTPKGAATMQYDLSNTRDIVNRLTLLGNNLRLALVIVGMVQYGVLMGIFGGLIGGVIWIIFLLVGILVGAGIGYFTSNALAAVLEWMAQVLISLQPRE